MPPETIRKFSLFYLGAFAVSLIGNLLNFGRMSAQVEQQTAGAGFALGSGLVSVSLAIGALLTLLLWYLVVRKGLAIAKWIVALFFLISLFGALGIFAGGISSAEAIALVAIVLEAIAVWFLFRPESNAWFARDRAVAPDAADPAD